jgi:hypothetical protein
MFEMFSLDSLCFRPFRASTGNSTRHDCEISRGFGPQGYLLVEGLGSLTARIRTLMTRCKLRRYLPAPASSKGAKGLTSEVTRVEMSRVVRPLQRS